MAGPVSTAREIGQTPARTSSIDSAISAISSKSLAQKGLDGQTSDADIAHLIKTAGSPEAVIQYLLKEKNSQAQQNSQLWRLVDKQRAMILGLNKDLERALKDKEKYRKKLKDVMALPGFGKVLGNGSAAHTEQPGSGDPKKRLPNGSEAVRSQSLDTPVPDSPNLDSDSQKHSPTDMSMAPYPITPPADQPNAPSSSTAAVGDMLDPSRVMPRPEEHALDRYNHEAEEQAVDDARKEAQNSQMKDLPISMSLPPSRSLPSEPPSVPPPRPPPAPPTTAPPQPSPGEKGLGQFPAPPPRKGPPAPLQIAKGKIPASSSPEEEDSDTDYDDILGVDGVGDERRGRRKTREEDEYKREMAAQQEAEQRSLSKKTKSPQHPQPTPLDHGKDSATIPLSPRRVPPPIAVKGEMHPSMDGVMKDLGGPPSISGQGLPASPRPFGNMGGMRQAMASPPMSPRGMPMANGAPLSPRPPRQPIPLPSNTPLAAASPQTSAAGPPLALNSPKPLNIARPGPPPAEPASPMTQSRESPTERTGIFKGFVSDEFPGLLLPPNALLSIEVRVASSRMKPSRASLLSLTQLEEDPVFTLAVLSRADGAELWRVEKDSASLSKLDQRMKKCAAFTARTPDRALFSGHSPAKLDARRIALDQYMDELLNTPLDTETAIELCKYFSTNALAPNSGETSFSKSEAETGNLRKGAGGRPLISGYLTKRGKNFGGWKARYFALDGPLLKYYETPGGAHLGTIKLQNAQIGKQAHNPDNQSPARANNSDEDNQYRHAFLVLEPKKKDSSSHVKHVLCAESDMERDQWVDTLLQWIDYRDPEEEAAGKRGGQDRQGGSDRQRGQGKKKRENTKSQHGQSSSETLIGVSYDSTTAGDAPQSGQRPKAGNGSSDRPRTAGGERPKTGMGLPGNPHDTEFQVPTISAPRDPQIISDSSTWGAKGGLMPPTVEEKKQRKRSFFGFGPKTRSSSDGQDSLFGNEGTSNSTPPQNEYKGPVRQVFGASVAEAVRFNAPVDVSVPLPAVVYRCIQYLDHRDAIFEEGIFRLSGSNVVIKQLRERFNTESDVDLVNDPTYYDIHAVASLLKLYLRELPTTILTRDLHLEFLAVTELSNVREKVIALRELVQRLPQANATLLMYLIAFLIKIINNSDRNKMTVRNVGIVFSPTLNIPAPVFAMFLQNYEPIFGIDPEEYELPSPAPDSDTQSQVSGREPGPRPSTAQGTSVSPHRQRLMQSADPSRGTTTPPLLHSLNDARGASTPPPSFPMNRQGGGYEPQYINQQPQQGHRPAYEAGYNVPQGFDPSGFYAPPRSANPGYDRPLYASDGGGNPDRRRESAIFGMGGQNLNPQQSKSRLREETLF